jgi:ubiquinone/menaquinone biosynthesis C-methylase UbiE
MKDEASNSIRESYDRIAEEYARRIFDELDHKPFDRQLLDRFAARIRKNGPACDMGCGPGHVARYLHNAGVSIWGLDLSPAMVAQARKLNAGMIFREGDMTSLDLPDASLSAITAFYAIVNIPKASLPRVFSEMARVLQPDGLLLLAFHTGDEIIREEELWGFPISMDFMLLQPPEISMLLEAAGLIVEEILERDPYPDVEYPSHRAYILARKP